jgi:hypothetical protein
VERKGGGVVALAVVVLIAGWFIGWRLLRGGGSMDEYVPTCKTQTVKAGEDLASNLVTVDVYNASDRGGLANTVSTALQARGFRQGAVANSPSQIKPLTVTVLALNESDPRVQLVAQQFDKVDLREPDFSTSSGVAVLVGPDFEGLKDDAPTTIKAASEVSVCF